MTQETKFKIGDWVIFKNIPFLEGVIKDISPKGNVFYETIYLVKTGLFKKRWFGENELLLM